jgi:glycosyltransferase involved in cell wall biosynthesis
MLKDAATERFKFIKSIAFLIYVKPILNRSKIVHFSDEGESISKFAKRISSKTAIIPNAVADPRFVKTLQNKEKLGTNIKILFFSRVIEHKGFHIAIQSIAELSKEFSNLEFNIAGPIEDKEYFEQNMKSMRTNLNIRYLGIVDGKAKTNLLNSCDILLMPTRSESFGMSIAEALMHNMIVICSGDVIWRQHSDEKTLIWVDRCSRNYVDELRKIMYLSKSELSSRQKKAPGKVQQYTAEEISKKYIKMYSGVS